MGSSAHLLLGLLTIGFALFAQGLHLDILGFKMGCMF